MHNKTVLLYIFMHAYIVFEPNAVARQQIIADQLTILHISKFNCTTLTSDELSIGIAETRLFIRSLSLSPHSGDSSAGVIANAHLLTPEAQQSLLKTLEEPPSHAYIFLGAENRQQLLPTIMSRCITIAHTKPPTNQSSEEEYALIKTCLFQILDASQGERVRLIQGIGKSKEDVNHWIDGALYALQNKLINNEEKNDQSVVIQSLIHRLILAKKYLANNIQPMLIIEHAFLMGV